MPTVVTNFNKAVRAQNIWKINQNRFSRNQLVKFFFVQREMCKAQKWTGKLTYAGQNQRTTASFRSAFIGLMCLSGKFYSCAQTAADATGRTWDSNPNPGQKKANCHYPSRSGAPLPISLGSRSEEDSSNRSGSAICWWCNSAWIHKSINI